VDGKHHVMELSEAEHFYRHFPWLCRKQQSNVRVLRHCSQKTNSHVLKEKLRW